MTRVSFYILGSPHSAGTLPFAIQLLERAFTWRRGMHVHAKDAKQLEVLQKTAELSGLSFDPVPDSGAQALTLCCQREPIGDQAILLNLSDEVPPFFSRFDETWEIVCKHTDNLHIGRDKYRFYRDRGYQIANQHY